MKTILCYGDSNTWGTDPVADERHPYEIRWTTVLQRELGDGYLVICEGLCGRTTVWDDPIEGHKNGAAYLPPCLASHKPVDLVVIMLGTNDLKVRFSLPSGDIAQGVGALVDIVKNSACGPGGAAPEVLVLVPPEIRNLTGLDEMFAGSREKSLRFPEVFRSIATERNVPILEVGRVVRFSDADGVHFEADQLSALGRLVAEEARKIL